MTRIRRRTESGCVAPGQLVPRGGGCVSERSQLDNVCDQCGQREDYRHHRKMNGGGDGRDLHESVGEPSIDHAELFVQSRQDQRCNESADDRKTSGRADTPMTE